MKQLKIMLTLFWTATLIVACSYIDKMEIADIFSVETEYVDSTEGNPGGYWVYFYTNGIITSQIFLSNGRDGVDGLNGIDGIDGADGVSVSITTTEVEGGTLITITQGDQVTEVFVRDGVDGTNGTNGLNGLDGIDGQDGSDGASVTMSSEETEGGTILYFYINDILISQIFVVDGQNGLDGLPGADGEDGVNGIDGVSTTITTETTEGGYYLIFWENDVEVTRIFVSNGVDGTNGVDGDTVTVRTETVEGGTNLYITYGDETVIVFIADGEDGADGQDGSGNPDDYEVCIKHTIQNANDPWFNDPRAILVGNSGYIILTQTLSEFVQHVYDVHNGSATQGAADSWSDCIN